jgi:hypothetical protein
MTLARSIINATNRAASILRDARTHVDVEDAASIEHVCRVAAQHLRPEAAGWIAEAMLNPRQQTRAWLAGEEVRTTHGKNGVEALPVVPEETKS